MDYLFLPTEQKSRQMTSFSTVIQGSVLIGKLFEMMNQEFEAQGRKYQLLPNFGISCTEQRGLKVTSFAHACESPLLYPLYHNSLIQDSFQVNKHTAQILTGC